MVAKLVALPTSEEDWLNKADDEVLGCRGQTHAFPKLRNRRGRLPKGISVIPPSSREGVYTIEATCPDCGTTRIMDTLPDGEIRAPARYRYIYPDNYKPPKGLKISKREAFRESWRRTKEEVDAELARQAS